MDSPTTPGQIVGRNVRAVRDEQLLSQRELAERSGVAKITIATLELGRSAHPRRRTVEKLASALGVPVEDLIRGDLAHPKAGTLPEPTLWNSVAEGGGEESYWSGERGVFAGELPRPAREYAMRTLKAVERGEISAEDAYRALTEHAGDRQ